MRDPSVTTTALDDGVVVYERGSVRSLYACEFCGAPFHPVVAHQKTCGAAPCQAKRRQRNKVESLRRNPEAQRKARERNRRWCEQNRGVKRRQPWLLGAPPYGTHLPGGGVEIAVSPHPRWPIEHRNTRALHGMMTRLMGDGHKPRWPRFALVPWPCALGWGAYLWERDMLGMLAGKAMPGILFDREVTVTFSPARLIKAPRVTKRGRQRVRIDTITPVCTVSTGRPGDQRTRPFLRATADAIRGAIGLEFPERLGIPYRLIGDDLRVELVSHDTRKATVPLGGKYGVVVGWEGSCIVEVNAPARWLLECAALVGLGGRTAFGFGRVRVSPC